MESLPPAARLTPPADRRRRLLQAAWLDWLGPGLIGFWLIVGIWLALRRHDAFQTQTFDLGYYTQVVWNTSAGRWFANSLKHPTFLTDHFSLALAGLAPLFWLAPDARTLLVVAVIALGLSIVPAYLILRARHPWLAPLLVFGFVLNPLLHQTALEEFHEIMLAAPALALALYAMHRERLRLLLFALGLTLLVREDMGMYVASFGQYLFLRYPHWRWPAVGIVLAGSLWTLGVTLWIMPALGDGAYSHTLHVAPGEPSIYHRLGANAGNPRLLFEQLITPAKLRAVWRMLLPLAGLPLAVLGELALWAPAVVALLLLPISEVGALRAWYVAPLIPLLWAAAALAASRWQAQWAGLALGGLAAASLAAFWAWSPFPGGGRYDPKAYALTARDRLGREVLTRVPRDASVAAQSSLGPHLATREQFYLHPWFDEAAPPNYIVLDAASPGIYPFTEVEHQVAIKRLQMDPSVHVAWEQDGYFIFQPHGPAEARHRGSWRWEPWLELTSYSLAQTDAAGAFQSEPFAVEPGRVLRVSLYWTALAPMTSNYVLSVVLSAADGYILAQDDVWPARGLVPTLVWDAGRALRNTHYLHLPDGPLPEPMTLQVIVYDTDTLVRLAPEAGYELMTLYAASGPAPAE